MAPLLARNISEVLTNLANWFRRISCLRKLLTHARTMDDGQWANTKAHIKDIVKCKMNIKMDSLTIPV